MPRVSVLMPVYNVGKFLSEAIDSIISQTFTDWELILINDGSTDESETILSKYDDERIYYLKNQTNLGLIKTLNRGIDFCQGEYIARMDADDISHPNRLKLQVEFMDKHSDYLMCGTDAAIINNNGEKTGKIRNLTSNNLLQINLLFSPPFIHPSMMIKRNILTENKYDEAYKHVEDYELWCRIAKLGKIANINTELLKYRWHDSNVSVLNNEVQEVLKDKIITNQLRLFGLSPTKEELYCHKITFRLFRLGEKQDIPVNSFEDISAWFSKLLNQNKIKKYYNQSDFIAFLWARWIVLCISQKRYKSILMPRFASLRPAILIKLFRLIAFLKKK